MYIDKGLLLSDAQDVRANGSKASENTIDLSVAGRDIGKGEQLYAVVVVDAYTRGGNDSVTISLITSINANLNPPTTILSTPAIPYTKIAAGMVPIVIPIPPGIEEQYLGLNYACATIASVLNVTAFVAKDVQTNL